MKTIKAMQRAESDVRILDDKGNDITEQALITHDIFGETTTQAKATDPPETNRRINESTPKLS